jgi:hypothetical protein
MPFTLDNVVPWGRSMEEYVAMFELSERELNSRILGCADGPASFNAEMNAQGRRVVSVDPLYQFTGDEIRSRIDATYPTMIEQLYENLDDYVWTRIPSPEALGELRMTCMRRFLADFSTGKREGRYLVGSLPQLPFADGSFDLALCAHFLFLYSDQLSAEFHCRAIQEMLRVAREARIFSLLALGGHPSPHLDVVCRELRNSNQDFEIKTVDYEFQRGGNQMLRIG